MLPLTYCGNNTVTTKSKYLKPSPNPLLSIVLKYRRYKYKVLTFIIQEFIGFLLLPYLAQRNYFPAALVHDINKKNNI